MATGVVAGFTSSGFPSTGFGSDGGAGAAFVSGAGAGSELRRRLAAVLLLAAGVTAALLPALRATHIQPVVALREQ